MSASEADRAPVVVLVTGLSGTGKSTLADVIAQRLRGPVLAWDWFMAALTPFDDVQRTFKSMTPSRYRAVGWSLVLQTARRQLRLGLPVVVDALAGEEDVTAVRALARECDASSLVALLRCDDEVIQRARVEQRSRSIPGWHELTWEFVSRMRREWTEPADVDLVLDSTQPIDDLLAAVEARL